jgi:hypothetical protein
MPELVFQQASDTMLREQSPTTSSASVPSLSVDGNSGGGNESQVLLRFDDLQFDQIPEGAAITSATLTVQSVDTGSGAELHRMLVSWSEDDTYASLGDGVQADSTEAIAGADLVTGRIGALGPTTFDVTTSVQAWANGAENNGWALLSSGNNGWDFSASEGTPAPTLTVTYTLNPDTPEIPPPPPPSSDTPFDVTLTPTDSTPTVAGSGDRADDPAFILHPSNLSQSVILGTDKATDGSTSMT